jgi:hypothetical protein
MASTLTSLTAVDERTACRALARELPRELRELRVAVMRETLANGVPVSSPALTVVLSALDEQSDDPLLFTASGLEELLWFGVEHFCEELGIDVPSGCPAALHALLAAAVRLDQLRPGSDGPRTLFSTLGALGAR